MIEFPKYIFIDDSTVNHSYQPNVIRSEMDVGPQKTRPIQSRPLYSIAFGVAIPVRRFPEFQTWFFTTLRSGTSWFLLKDPIDGTEKRFRFVETDLEWTKSGNLMRSAFVIEAYNGV